MRSTRTFGNTMFDAVFFNVRAFYQKMGNSTPELYGAYYVTFLQGVLLFYCIPIINVFFSVRVFTEYFDATFPVKFKYLLVVPALLLYAYNQRKYTRRYKELGYLNTYNGRIWNIKTWLFPILMAVVPIAVFAMGIVLLELSDTLHE